MSLRRFEEHRGVGNPKVLAPAHPAAVEGRSLYQRQAGQGAKRVLISGFNSVKIGKRCLKGRWKGMPIYTLTLEERKTCPRSCDAWLSCFGNKMHMATRNQAGADLEARLLAELSALNREHRRGFIVRLHVLGDFYSVEYVQLWAHWLNVFPALHVFGFTARRADDPIGAEIRRLSMKRWDRFAVRSSGGYLPDVPSSHIDAHVDDGIVCPAQTGRSSCCGTCSLCWNSQRPIIFLEH